MQCDVHRVSTSQCRVLAPAEHAISGIIAVALAGAMVDNTAVLRDVIASVLLASLATSGGGGIVIGHPPNDCPLRPREFIISWWFGTPPPRSRRDSGHLGGGAKARLPLLITHPPTEIPLSHLRICIEDAYGLRRITAAPCPFGSAYIAESWARACRLPLAACPNYQTMRSPRRRGKPSGNTWAHGHMGHGGGRGEGGGSGKGRTRSGRRSERRRPLQPFWHHKRSTVGHADCTLYSCAQSLTKNWQNGWPGIHVCKR